jgi:hypothetical protein
MMELVDIVQSRILQARRVGSNESILYYADYVLYNITESLEKKIYSTHCDQILKRFYDIIIGIKYLLSSGKISGQQAIHDLDYFAKKIDLLIDNENRKNI